jgi:hypothetical protein
MEKKRRNRKSRREKEIDRNKGVARSLVAFRKF